MFRSCHWYISFIFSGLVAGMIAVGVCLGVVLVILAVLSVILCKFMRHQNKQLSEKGDSGTGMTDSGNV